MLSRSKMADAVTESNIFPHWEGTRFVVTMVVADLRSFRDDLEEMIGVLPGRQDVAQLVEAEHGHPGIVVDEAVDALCLRELWPSDRRA